MTTPHIAQKAPYATELEEGKTYYWCACGHSAKQPMCDGAHKGSDFKPMVFTAEKTGTAHLCGCKATKTPPYCDGTHSKL
ncbi:CDGSH iron-sulfur domain-containing protein [Varunaivibrio sulfuroxidans]|uniref:Iron-binding CDGSH zinc finger protein n=1 Tax=Varunaivibrio sulfuroxidans TaxID=1773489 RepID=A0A4R3JAJ8_9PROT|nr:CDGSH iron-sulfur domain-containing protein [Varunaivibrio sulfuroxidans]TCS62662.1 iron-binding CDGSH zinc finger protein [Varunaivibrio sulfuroxidans]WES30673.1 CDGSH iron-sulfur domain-containing protein [Varunaivibrio sulfuroxidans]